MGIYDRHYFRDTEPRPRGLSALRMLSINTWLIVLCVAVFVINDLWPTHKYKPIPVSSDIPFAVQVQLGTSRYQPGIMLNKNTVPIFDLAQRDVLGNPTFVGNVYYADSPPLYAWLHFSTFTAIKGIEFWRFIGFQFLHANHIHLLVNMIGLFFFGPIVERYLGSKRYLAFYLLCGIFGAVLFVFLNLLGVTATIVGGEGLKIPGLLFNSTFTPLVGASAGIFGVLMAGAFLMPRAEVLFFFLIPMQMRTLAYVLVAIALFSLITDRPNAGGEAGHLGGALAGFYFIRRPHHLHGFFDFLGRVDPTSHHYRRTRAAPRHRYAAPMRVEEVDRILDKINREGLHSLTDEEKRILGEASRRR